MAEQCIFCRIVKGEIPAARVVEDDQVLAFLDIGPVNEGHCLLLPKAHHARLEDCPPELAAALARRLGPLARAIIAAVGAEGYNVLNNAGRCAGQLVEHVHFHVIPRRPGDGVFTQWPAGKYPPGRAEAVAARIRANL